MESWLVERKQCLQVLRNAHGFKDYPMQKNRRVK